MSRWLLAAIVAALLVVPAGQTAASHWQPCSTRQAATAQLACAKKNVRTARLTLRWLKANPELGTPTSRSKVAKAHRWLLRYGLAQLKQAQARMMPATFGRWDYLVRNCEAPGSGWYANTGNGFYFGPQFTSGTWHANGGGPVREMGDRGGRPMSSYSLAYIVRIADNTMRSQGPGAWPLCHRRGYI